MTATKDFHFKQFSISGGQCGMPVSTDGVLLGAWIQLRESDISTLCPQRQLRLLDIGTGTGLLALMCAQRNPTIAIDAIDLDFSAVETAAKNITQSPWAKRMNVFQQDVLSYTPAHQYDFIICNPPYFINGPIADNQARAQARHTQTFTHQGLLSRCENLLSQEGRANFILPFTEGQAFLKLSEPNWNVTRICDVSPTPSKPVHRLLIELALPSKQRSQSIEKTELTIREEAGYSKAFTQLTQDFYLKM